MLSPRTRDHLPSSFSPMSINGASSGSLPLIADPIKKNAARYIICNGDDEPVAHAEETLDRNAEKCRQERGKDSTLIARSSQTSWLYLVGLNAFAFPYSVILSTMGLVTLPVEASRFFPNQKALFLGTMLAVSGISQLICPLIGYMSDRCTSVLGRRRPFVVIGSLVLFVGCLGMWYGHEMLSPAVYSIGLFIGTTGLNVAYAGFSVLNSDLVPPGEMGKASGVMAILSLLGGSIGIATLCIWRPYMGLDLWVTYPIYIAIGAGGLIVTHCSVKEQVLSSEQITPIRCIEVTRCYYITQRSHKDFFWVFVIRTCYYLALSAQAFLLYYLKDTIIDASLPQFFQDPENALACIVLISQLGGAFATVPSGHFADKYGRKRIVEATCGVIAAIYVAFMLFPPLYAAFAIAFIYGAANGAFLTVDYALACDTLPSKENSARDLGLWGIAAFLGSTIGPLLLGPVLFLVGSDSPNMDVGAPTAISSTEAGGAQAPASILSDVDPSEAPYSRVGYQVIFSLTFFFSILAGCLVRKVKGSR